jgi:hypothetical protein
MIIPVDSAAAEHFLELMLLAGWPARVDSKGTGGMVFIETGVLSWVVSAPFVRRGVMYVLGPVGPEGLMAHERRPTTRRARKAIHRRSVAMFDAYEASARARRDITAAVQP